MQVQQSTCRTGFPSMETSYKHHWHLRCSPYAQNLVMKDYSPQNLTAPSEAIMKSRKLMDDWSGMNLFMQQTDSTVNTINLPVEHFLQKLTLISLNDQGLQKIYSDPENREKVNREVHWIYLPYQQNLQPQDLGREQIFCKCGPPLNMEHQPFDHHTAITNGGRTIKGNG